VLERAPGWPVAFANLGQPYSRHLAPHFHASMINADGRLSQFARGCNASDPMAARYIG
jgi:hypothetical protein